MAKEVSQLLSPEPELKSLSSFLYVRIQQNPKHYAFAADKNKSKEKSWDAWLDHYVSVRLSNRVVLTCVGGTVKAGEAQVCNAQQGD